MRKSRMMIIIIKKEWPRMGCCLLPWICIGAIVEQCTKWAGPVGLPFSAAGISLHEKILSIVALGGKRAQVQPNGKEKAAQRQRLAHCVRLPN